MRSVASDREAGVFEYMLSLPVSVGAWYWGRFVGRFVTMFAPVFLAMAGAVGLGRVERASDPLEAFFYLFGAAALAVGLFPRAGIPDFDAGALRPMWRKARRSCSGSCCVLFLDLLLLGLMLQERIAPELIIGISLINPLQVFRTAAMALFDPQLVLLGPAAFTILDRVGPEAYLAWACLYPALIGLIAAAIGFWRFKSSDLI